MKKTESTPKTTIETKYEPAAVEVAEILAKIDRTKLTDSSFLNIETEQIGLCVDLVYSCDDCNGWGESILILMDEKYTNADIKTAKRMAGEIARILQIPVEENISQSQSG